MYQKLSKALQVYYLVKLSSHPLDVVLPICYYPHLIDEKRKGWSSFINLPTVTSLKSSAGILTSDALTPKDMHSLTFPGFSPLKPTPWLLTLSFFRNIPLETPGPQIQPCSASVSPLGK